MNRPNISLYQAASKQVISTSFNDLWPELGTHLVTTLQQKDDFAAVLGVDFIEHLLAIFSKHIGYLYPDEDTFVASTFWDILQKAHILYAGEKIIDDFSIVDEYGVFLENSQQIIVFFNTLAVDLISSKISFEQASLMLRQYAFDNKLNQYVQIFDKFCQTGIVLPSDFDNPSFAMLLYNLYGIEQASSIDTYSSKQKFQILVQYTKKSLENRYASVQSLIHKPFTSIDEALVIRTDTILTNYTFWSMFLGLCFDFPDTNLTSQEISDLQIFFDQASLLIGLFNDVGTLLEIDFHSIVDMLESQYAQFRDLSPRTFFKNCAMLPCTPFQHTFSRLIKDAYEGEYNTILNANRDIADNTHEMWEIVFTNICYAQTIYQQTFLAYHRYLDMCLQHPDWLQALVATIDDFMQFNKKLYGFADGDYDKIIQDHHMLS